MSDAPGQVADAPLIAVVVDSLVVRKWVSASIAALARRHPRMRVVVLDTPQRRAFPWPAPRGAFAVVAIDEALVELAHTGSLAEHELLRDADIVIDLGRASAIRAHGNQVVLSLWHGAAPATSPAVLVRDVTSGRNTVTTTVVALDADGRRTVLAEARTALTRRSLAANRERVAWKSPTLLLSAIDSVVRSDDARPATLAAPKIANLAVVTGVARVARDLARSTLASFATETSYAVAWGRREPSDSPMRMPAQMNWVDHPHDRFLADPFLARENEQTFVFVEDFSRVTGYATIGVFEPRDPSSTFRTVLDRGRHLSYPFVFRDEETGDWLMLPEMAGERRVTLFRASSFPDEWHEDTVLLDDVVAYDPTIIFRAGRFWLFYASGSAGSALDDELHLAFSETLRGPYTPHPRNPVKSDVIGARPAGRLFDWNGQLIRPAQDSAAEYGYAVVFQKVTALTPTAFAEEPVGRILPDWAPRIRGTHSWDVLDDIAVTDAKRVLPRSGASRFRPQRGR